MNTNKFKSFFSSKAVKVVLVLCTLFILLLQTCMFAVKPTSAEVQEKIKQAQLLATLNLNKDASGNYLIENSYDLYSLGYATLSSQGLDTNGLKFKQTADIDMSERTYYYPVGSTQYPFKGTYYGQNYQIKNLFVTGDNRHKGVFGTVKNATIENVIVVSGSITQTTSGYNVGAIVGQVLDDAGQTSYIRYCMNFGCTVSATKDATGKIGGIIGKATSEDGYTCVDYNFNSADITHAGESTAYAGGIIGYASNLSYLTQNMNTGRIKAGVTDVTTTSYAGGIIGQNLNTVVKNCCNTGSIYAYAKEQTDTDTTYDSPATKAVVTGSQTNQNFILFNQGSTTLKQVYKNAYAGGICGAFEGSDFSSTIVCSNCVSTAVFTTGGYDKTTINTTFYSFMLPGSVTKPHIGVGEKYVVSVEENLSYGLEIGKVPKGYSFSACYSKYSDTSADQSVSVSVTSEAYNSTLSSSSVGYTYPNVSKPTTPTSWYTGKGVTLTASKTSSSLSISCDGTNINKVLTTTTAGGDCPTSQPGYFDNKIVTGTTTMDGGRTRAVYIDFRYSWAYYKDPLIGSTKYETHYVDTEITKVALPASLQYSTKISSGSVEALSSSYWAVSSTINSNYPYLKRFYWAHNSSTPS